MDLDTFLPYMRDVTRTHGLLRELNLMWRVTEVNARMNCPEEAHRLLPMMAATLEGFQALERDLVQSLVQQKTASVIAEAGTRARHVIDIIVRNLFERTADVGFLATDRELCEYVAGIRSDRQQATDRLLAYRAKYTVYDEIFLLDTEGNVLANIDAGSPLQRSQDPLIAQALRDDAMVESFRSTDLRPGGGRSLIYSRRMLHPVTNAPVGVLCLVFGFATEMHSIFSSRHATDGRSNLLLLDGDNRVIASADEAWVPVGDMVPVHHSEQPELRLYAGRTYLVQTFRSLGYQGYPGPPGWQAQAMVPLDVAFIGRQGGALEQLGESVSEGLLSHARTFCPPLQDIITAAETIRRVVWNGQVMTSGEQENSARLKTVLEQISETGARTEEAFSGSIQELYDTVLSSRLSSAEFVTQLLVELLDRNLYERSDDCRWWAATAELRAALRGDATDAAACAVASQVLEDINALYTVYTRLVVYDRHGRIVSASSPAQPDGSSVIGTPIDAACLQAVLALPSGQSYHVSPFVPSPLYGDRPTYLYHAAIRDLDDERVVLGGIGIVFDSEKEFAAMLDSGLQGRAGAVAAFVDRGGRVISSTGGHHAPGSLLRLPADLLALENAASASRVSTEDGVYQLLACSATRGYREFKTSDGYRDDVLAVLLEPMGELRETRLNASQRREAKLPDVHEPTAGTEFATFFIGADLYALASADVLEALAAADVRPVSLGGVEHRVGMLTRRREGRVDSHVWVFDLERLLGIPAPVAELGKRNVIVLRAGGIDIGLLVGELHGVLTADETQLTPIPRLGETPSGVSHLLRPRQSRLMVQVLDIPTLLGRIGGGLVDDESTAFGEEAPAAALA